MSDADPGPTADEETIFLADNVDEFVQRTRYQQILEAREHAAETLRNTERIRDEFRGRRMTSDEVERATQRYVRKAVQAYILECETFYQRTDAGHELWTNTPLASFQVKSLLSPPTPHNRGERVGELGEIEPLQDRSGVLHRDRDDELMLAFPGVRSFLEFAEPVVRYEYSVSLNSRNPHATDTNQTRETLSAPIEVSREALRATNALVNHLGTGIDVGQESGTVDGDYSDILDRLDDK